MQSIARVIARNTVVSWLNFIIAAVSNLILTPLILRQIGIPAYGVWILISQICGYAFILDLQPAVGKYVSAARVLNDKQQLGRVLSTALVLHCAIGTFAFIMLSVLFPAFVNANMVDLGGVATRTAVEGLVITALATAISFPGNVFVAGLKGYLRIDLVSWVGIGATTVRGGMIVASLVVGAGLVGVALAALCSAVGTCGAAFALLRRQARGVGLWQHPSIDIFRLIRSYGLVSAVGTIGWYLTYGTDAILIGALVGAVDVAHFGLAASILVLVSGMISAFTASFMPLGSELESGDTRKQQLQRAYLNGTKVALAIGVPLVMLLVLLGPELIALWVGAELAATAGRLLQVMALAYLPVIANSVGFQIALGAGMHRAVATMSLCEGTCHVTLCTALGYFAGTPGVVVGTLITALLFHGVAWPHILVRWVHLPFSGYWREAIRPAVVPTISALTGYALAASLTGAGPLASATAKGIGTVTGYFTCAWFTCLNADERAWLRRGIWSLAGYGR